MAADALRERVESGMPQAWEDLARAVSFRSVADGSEPAECERMVDWTVQTFAGVGVRTRRRTKQPTEARSSPAVLPDRPARLRFSCTSTTTSSPPLPMAGSHRRGS